MSYKCPALRKAQGAGSRGGVIIGYTRSQKPVYQGHRPTASAYKDFTADDHQDAGALHHAHLRGRTNTGHLSVAGEAGPTYAAQKDTADGHFKRAYSVGQKAAAQAHTASLHVLGHTGGGHPVYAGEPGSKARYAKMTPQDHADAADLHRKASDAETDKHRAVAHLDHALSHLRQSKKKLQATHKQKIAALAGPLAKASGPGQWQETKHPRATDGEFTSGGGAAAKPSAAEREGAFRAEHGHLTPAEHRQKAKEHYNAARHLYSGDAHPLSTSYHVQKDDERLGAVHYAQGKMHEKMAEEKDPKQGPLTQHQKTDHLSGIDKLAAARARMKDARAAYKRDDRPEGNNQFKEGKRLHALADEEIAHQDGRTPIGHTKSGKPVTMDGHAEGYSIKDHEQAIKIHERLQKDLEIKNGDAAERSKHALRQHEQRLGHLKVLSGEAKGIGTTQSGKPISHYSHLHGHSDDFSEQDHVDASNAHYAAKQTSPRLSHWHDAASQHHFRRAVDLAREPSKVNKSLAKSTLGAYQAAIAASSGPGHLSDDDKYAMDAYRRMFERAHNAMAQAQAEALARQLAWEARHG